MSKTRYRGSFDAEATYEIGDVVDSANGKFWLCVGGFIPLENKDEADKALVVYVNELRNSLKRFEALGY